MINKIDHLVLNIDRKYQINKNDIENIQESKIPYLPDKGKKTKGFRASNLWIGKEYLEMITILNDDGGGWTKDWVEKYHEGHRGLICVMLSVSDINELYTLFKHLNMSKPERITFSLFKFFKMRSPWKNCYLPFFENEQLQIGFQQIDSDKVQENMQKKMVPNSVENGIHGIEIVELYGKWSDTDFSIMATVFNNCNQTEQSFNVTLPSQQKLIFIKSDENKTIVKTTANNMRQTIIENVQINT
ncbi:hypothetical protein [Breznakia pachnodae]|uniref:Glyoxalase-like domain-containing protein n=1 Tax=Breznakia pachnodae TaxID=265178 RepID=A0ABU0E0J1_9FIRM|nr:hypothetical protein [Breznakia pachnodae]MDQ0360341.1 hypothetical protein [Breznakia pachnodae]